MNDGTLIEEAPDDPLFNTRLGMPSAGTIGDVVPLGGPRLGPDGVTSVNVFAFGADDETYLGSLALPGFSSVRTWLEVGDALYGGVQVPASEGGGWGRLALHRVIVCSSLVRGGWPHRYRSG